MSSNELVEQIMAQVIARVATPEKTVSSDTPHPKRETAMAEKKLQFNGVRRYRDWRHHRSGDRQCRQRLVRGDETRKTLPLHRYSWRPYWRRPPYYGRG